MKNAAIASDYGEICVYIKKRKEKYMQTYSNLGGDSGVKAFEIGFDYIKVQFQTGRVYTYSYRSAGQIKVEEMKRLATQGCGLNSYIMRHARMDYEK